MDSVPSAPPEQPIVSPEVPVIKPKSRILIWVVGGIVVLGIGIIIGLLLNKKSSSAPKIPPTPSPVSQATPTPDPTAEWETFLDPNEKFKFRYPKELRPEDQKVQSDVSEHTQLFSVFTMFVGSKGPSFEVRVRQGLDSQQLEKEDFDYMEGHVDYQIVKREEINLSGKKATKVMIFVGPPEERKEGGGSIYIYSDTGLKESMSILQRGMDRAQFDQILSTFKFIESLPEPTLKPSKTLKYYLPAEWKTVQDGTGSFEIGYDPSTMKGDGAVSQSITLLRLRPDPSMGYSSHFNVRLLSYSGGSRHQFIYSSMQVVPTKQDYLPGYKEVEYLYNGKSCLFLEGIGVSQIPTTWGMCDVGNNQAFLITTWTSGQELETMIQTIRLLRLGLIGGAEG